MSRDLLVKNVESEKQDLENSGIKKGKYPKNYETIIFLMRVNVQKSLMNSPILEILESGSQ